MWSLRFLARSVWDYKYTKKMANKPKTPDFEAMAKEMLKDAPKDIAERARAFFLSSFIREGFTDASFIPWPKRANPDAGGKILSQSLELKNSIRITEMTMQRIVIKAGEGLPYAAIHNNGGRISIPITLKMRKFFWAMYYKTEDNKWKYMALNQKDNMTVDIPKRQFIGNSMTLDNKIDQWMINNILKAEKNLKF